MTDPSQNSVLVGEHLEGQGNTNVQVVQIRASNTPFIIPQIFTTFPNIINLFIHNSNLQSISIPDSVQLQYIDFHRNNIEHIANGTFSGQKELLSLKITSSSVEVIEQDAFFGLENLTVMNLADNRIAQIALPTFHTLTNLQSCDMKRNLVSRITCGVFGRNENLETLFLENNELNEICTFFSQRLSAKLTFLDLSGNRCINRSFQMGDDLGMIALNNALNPCFNNIRGEVPEIRRITLEFRGPLSLFDEFGNIIARVN